MSEKKKKISIQLIKGESTHFSIYTHPTRDSSLKHEILCIGQMELRSAFQEFLEYLKIIHKDTIDPNIKNLDYLIPLVAFEICQEIAQNEIESVIEMQLKYFNKGMNLQNKYFDYLLIYLSERDILDYQLKNNSITQNNQLTAANNISMNSIRISNIDSNGNSNFGIRVNMNCISSNSNNHSDSNFNSESVDEWSHRL